MDLEVVTYQPIDLHFSLLRQYSPGQYRSPMTSRIDFGLFKNVNPRNKRQEKRVCLIFKRNIAHLTHRCALRAMIIASARKLKSLFVQAKFTQTLCICAIQVANDNNSAIVIPTIRVNALHIVIALKIVTLVSNKKSILVEMFDFAVTQVDIFCKNELITVLFKFFIEKTQVLFFSNRNDNLVCLFKCSTISL